VREDLREDFVWEGAEGGIRSGVEWSGGAHAAFVDLEEKGGPIEGKMSWAGSIHACCYGRASALIYNIGNLSRMF
jgi:hypothetical protein